jgi:hypothetical protein
LVADTFCLPLKSSAGALLSVAGAEVRIAGFGPWASNPSALL